MANLIIFSFKTMPNFLMEDIMGIYKMEESMVQGPLNGITKVVTMGNLKMILLMDMEKYSIKMGVRIVANGKMIKLTVKEPIIMLIKLPTLENFQTI